MSIVAWVFDRFSVWEASQSGGVCCLLGLSVVGSQRWPGGVSTAAWTECQGDQPPIEGGRVVCTSTRVLLRCVLAWGALALWTVSIGTLTGEEAVLVE